MRLILAALFFSGIIHAQPGDPEFAASYAETCKRYAAAVAGNPQAAPHIPLQMQFGNYVQNQGFIPFGRPLSQLVTAGGAVYPDQWRIAPGLDATISARIHGSAGTGSQGVPGAESFGAGQGNVLELRWVGGTWSPANECGAMFIEHYIYALDDFIGRTIMVEFWAAVGQCCIQIIPAIWINWHNNDYEFMYGMPTLIGETWQRVITYFFIPPVGAHILSEDRYLAIGITTTHPTSPLLYLAKFRLLR